LNSAVSLDSYRRKRDFARTDEPKGVRRKSGAGKRRFVIQKHAASRLHYDFRLELGGTLKSWAVPKGIPFAAGEKRLAVRVEDHPVEYGGFEGTIPPGEYGAGTVMIWDRGTFEPLGSSPAKDLERGKIEFRLHGEKLEGTWTLVRMRGQDDQWLLIKSGSTVKPPSARDDDCSAASGRTMKEIAAECGTAAAGNPRKRKRSNPDGASGAVKFVEPMKARLSAGLPAHGEWTYEIKFDGFRALAVKDGRRVRLLSRNQKDLGRRFPGIVRGLSALPASRVVMDGEIVALDDRGRPSFQLLQDAGNVSAPVVFYVFDLLQEGARDLRDRPLGERRSRLKSLLDGVDEPLRFSGTLTGPPTRLLRKACALGLEGLIAKRAGSHYEAGRRSGAWLKIKCSHQQEFVICGYTPARGSRQFLGALLAGYYEGGRLRFAGRIGSGFSETSCRDLHQRLARIEISNPPFDELDEKASRSRALSPSELKRCRWVSPRFVCEVRFSGWTRDGRLRHPVFLGLREDKAPTDVIRERPAA
jgi:bifunctional non-homologous end joining protein LigD